MCQKKYVTMTVMQYGNTNMVMIDVMEDASL
jgi:hypothetical protein